MSGFRLIIFVALFGAFNSAWAESLVPLDGVRRYFCSQVARNGRIIKLSNSSAEPQVLSDQKAKRRLATLKSRLARIREKKPKQTAKAKSDLNEKLFSKRSQLKDTIEAMRRCLNGTLETPCSAISGEDSSSKPKRLMNGHLCSGIASPVVLLHVDFESGSSSCTGTIIRSEPLLVLTAAHCISDQNFGSAIGARALVGSEEHVATAAVTNPLYSGNNAFDLALVYFDDSATSIPAISGISAGQLHAPETGYVTAGYGATLSGEDPKGADGQLRAGFVSVEGSNGHSLIGVYDSYFSGLCFGDSGGPLLVYAEGKWRILGVSSAISSEAELCAVGTKLLFVDLVNSALNRGFIHLQYPEFFQ